MATMFPSKLPEEILHDHKRSAECRVYEALNLQLGSEYHVFYSSPWLGTRPDGSEVDGEADFIVAHPIHGILVIEVKGGRITIDRDGQWRSTDRVGITYKIKDPVAQARKSKHTLIEKLKISPLWKKQWVNFKHSVILPDVSRDYRDLRPDMPLDIFAFGEDLNSLNNWVFKRLTTLDKTDGDQTQLLGTDGIIAIDDLITRPIRLNIRLHSEIEEDLHQIDLLTEEQIWLLRELESNRRIAIAGAAGTGKTILAIEKARLLAEQGLNTLLLCYNAPLGLTLQNTFKDHPHVTATNFHQFCRQILQRVSGYKDDSLSNLEEMAEDELANLIIDTFAKTDLDEFDAIIIDEGQDFAEDWLKALEMLVKDGAKGTLYIFYDDNQNVMSKSVNYISSLPIFRYRLSRNFRNTRKIFEMADKFYTGDFVRAIGPEGNEIRWNITEDNALFRNILVSRVGDLINNNGVRPEEIAILVNDRKLAKEIAPLAKLGKYSVADAAKTTKGQITLDSVRRFKGLEAPVILLVLAADMVDECELLYTGMTRARAILELFGPEKLFQRISRICENSD